MNDYTTHSDPARTNATPAVEEKKKIEKVVSGTVKTKKKNGVLKLADVFLAEDVHTVKSFLTTEVLIPTLKRTFYDLITKGADAFIYGGKRGQSGSGFADKVSYVNYNSMSQPGSRFANAPGGSITAYSYDNLYFETHEAALEVLTRMDELIATYRVVSVSDFYELAGVPSHFTDQSYGWTELHTATIGRERDGWRIKLPKARPIR